MNAEKQKIIMCNAEAAAKSYVRGRKHLDLDDLTQEAIVAQLEAAKRYNPGFGVPFKGYTWRVAVLALLRYSLYQASPVTCKGGHLWKENLMGARAIPWRSGPPSSTIDDSAKDREAVIRNSALDTDLHPWHVGSIDALDVARVRERVVQVLGIAEADFAFGLLVEGWRPREVAQQHRVTAVSVTKDLQRTKRRLREDDQLRQLWETL